jgi:hypothetical protein
MDPNREASAATMAQARRDARTRRVGTIRRRVAAGAATLFAALFLVLAVRLASGHDPALARSAASGAKTAPAQTTYVAPGSVDGLFGGDDPSQGQVDPSQGGVDPSQGGVDASQGQGPQPMTSRQS